MCVKKRSNYKILCYQTFLKLQPTLANLLLRKKHDNDFTNDFETANAVKRFRLIQSGPLLNNDELWNINDS